MSGFKIGRGRPPKRSRFKKGQSGNPKGRPKGSRNFATEVNSQLRRPVVVKEGGVTKKVSKQEASAMALIGKAMQGDPRASGMLLAINEREAAHVEAAPPTKAELAILRRHLPRILRWISNDEEN